WPHVVACVVKNISITPQVLEQIIQLQEKLAITFLRQRKKGAIGIYPLNALQFPITYTHDTSLTFTPLEMNAPLNAQQILEQHPTGQKYASTCEQWQSFPYFVDAKKQILSMPPIINAESTGRVTTNSKDLFVE